MEKGNDEKEDASHDVLWLLRKWLHLSRILQVWENIVCLTNVISFDREKGSGMESEGNDKE